MATDFTMKQDRNGSNVDNEGTRETGPSDWQGEVSGMKGQAQSAADAYVGYGHYLLTGNTAQTGDLTLGSPWDWDDMLAISEVDGEWSQPGVQANSSPNANTPSNVIGTIDGTPDWVAGP